MNGVLYSWQYTKIQSACFFAKPWLARKSNNYSDNADSMTGGFTTFYISGLAKPEHFKVKLVYKK